MKCSLKQLSDALDYFKYNLSVNKDEAKVEIITRPENVEKGELLGCLTITISYEKEAQGYDRWIGTKVVKHSLEIYPDHENRNPRLTTEEAFEVKGNN